MRRRQFGWSLLAFILGAVLAGQLALAPVHADAPLHWYTVFLTVTELRSSSSSTAGGNVAGSEIATGYPLLECMLPAYDTQEEAQAAADDGRAAAPLDIWWVEQATDAPHAIGQAAADYSLALLSSATPGYQQLYQQVVDDAVQACAAAGPLAAS